MTLGKQTAMRRCRPGWRASRAAAAGRLVTHRLYRQPSLGLEQGQLRAGVRALAAGEDPHGWRARRPAGPRPGPSRSSPVSSVTCASSIQHAPVRAGVISAGVVGAALADLAAVVDGDLPGLRGHQRERGGAPARPAPSRRSRSAGSRGRGASSSSRVISSWLAPAPSAGDHQPARERPAAAPRSPPRASARWSATVLRPGRSLGRSIPASGSPVLSQYASSG